MTRRLILTDRMHANLLYVLRRQFKSTGDVDTRKLLNIVKSAAKGPMRLVLHCPECYTQHIDRPDAEEHWAHFCRNCGHTWKPAKVSTVGVERI